MKDRDSLRRYRPHDCTVYCTILKKCWVELLAANTVYLPSFAVALVSTSTFRGEVLITNTSY